MKKIFLPLLFSLMTLSGFAQIVPSNLEIGNALKQALEQGTLKSVTQLSAVDGFFGNASIKILFPPEAQKAEKTLRKLGMNKLCDDAIHEPRGRRRCQTGCPHFC